MRGPHPGNRTRIAEPNCLCTIIANCYMVMIMKTVRYLRDAQIALRRHATMAARIRAKVAAYAENPAAQANNIRALTGSTFTRLRIGDYRVIFEETATEIIVVKIGPRGSAYE